MNVSNQKVLNRGLLLMSVLWSAVFVEIVSAKEISVFQRDNLLSMSLEELSQIEVVSASRQSQKLNATSVPITVVSHEDIHYSGATNIYELLQFSPSIDVLRVERNQYAMGVRGLHEIYSDRTLVLINGRIAENTLFGGSEFLRQPLLMEDIERIEIVRGPGGAAWGANAFNGVINVITKKPEDCQGLLLSTQWNLFGDNYQQFRWAGRDEQWKWRISSGWNKQDSTSDALHESYQKSWFMGGGSFKVRDFSRTSTVDMEFINQLSQETELSFGVGRSHVDEGSFSMLRAYPQEDGFQETVRLFAKLQTQLDESSIAYIQWTGNYANTKWPSIIKYESYENDIESQLTFTPIENHTTTIGGNIRYTVLDQDRMYPTDYVFTHDPMKECMGGLFLIDRWQATERLAFEGQIRQDYSNNTGADWSTRLGAIYDLNKEINENIRLAYARSYRAPKVSPREFYCQRNGITINTNDDLDNEGLRSLELGYSRDLARNLSFSSNFYKQRYSDLIGYTWTYGAIPVFTNVYTPMNMGGADAYGAETELTWRSEKASITGWYSLNKFEDDGKTAGLNTTQQTRSYYPAQHKAGMAVRLFLPDNFVLNANYRYTSWTDGSHVDDHIGGSMDAPKSNVVDLTMSRAFKVDKANAEIMVGVSDLLNDTQRVIESVGDIGHFHETPGRIFFARFQIMF
jgi:iron complex outermembrane receptor protein